MKIAYATDLHGHDRLWKDFMTLSKEKGADLVIVGGDVAGHYSDGFRKEYKRIERRDGVECAEQAFPRHVEVQLNKQLTQWAALADSTLGKEVKIVMIAGNDDPLFAEKLMQKAGFLTPETDLVQHKGHEFLGYSTVNLTPWGTIREKNEIAIGQDLSNQLQRIKNPAHAIFVVHAPPAHSGLDHVNSFKGCGSTAVEDIIKSTQPIISFHGHIHQGAYYAAGGVSVIGQTVAINPGSLADRGVNKPKLNAALIQMNGLVEQVNLFDSGKASKTIDIHYDNRTPVLVEQKIKKSLFSFLK